MVVAAQRIRLLSGPKAITPSQGGVVYWMSRDQRAKDNWALLHAQSLAQRHKVGLSVIFCLVPTFHEATIRQYGFMLKGLDEVETDLRTLGIPFHVLSGYPVTEVPSFAKRHDVCALVTDFSPLRVGREWKSAVGTALDSLPLYEVDAHNVVPVWVASDKQEVGARTIRKKINDKLPTWLKDIPPLEPQAAMDDAGASSSSSTVASTPSTEEALSDAPAPASLSTIEEAELAALTKRLEGALASSPPDVAAAEPLLAQLERVHVGRALLAATGAGKAVNGLAKAKCGALSARAKALVGRWRASVAAAAAATGAGASAGGKPAEVRHPSASLLAEVSAPTDWKALRASLTIDRTVAEVDWIAPGQAAAHRAVAAFCATRLRLFSEKRNDPCVAALSDLSPYLHFGQLSAQRMALMVKAAAAKQGVSAAEQAGVDSFLEESIVRRELADNYCFYQPNYDNLDGAAGWARESLLLHAADPRPKLYSLEQLEKGKTHEDIWNAAQLQMVRTGKMHGFMRMYWAKKILEWSPDPAEALRRAIYLNDKYELDGRDPNGYVGCGWAIMGVHDMGWAERPIFGKIRFMNYDGCKRKFDIKRYAAKWNSAAPVASSSTGALPPAKKPRVTLEPQ